MKSDLYLVLVLDNKETYKEFRNAKSKIAAINSVRNTYKKNNDKRCLCTMSAYLVKERNLLNGLD